MTLDLVRDHTILSVVVGSRAYGPATDGGDIDRRGVFTAPAPLFRRSALTAGAPATHRPPHLPHPS